VTGAPGGEAARKITELRAEVKAAREAAAPLWADTAARLAKVEAALEAQQAQPGREGK
jgi:hypothetical protein